MIYELNDLERIALEPEQCNKWGPDKDKIISLVKVILTSNCSSCMLRRKINEINTLLSKHGDSIRHTYRHVHSTNKIDDTTNNSGSTQQNTHRIPCPDCVAKHISQAYVLQAEFFQGYTDNLELILSHLSEAMEECPSSNTPLKNAIHNMIVRTTVDKKPNVYPIVCSVLLETSGKASSDLMRQPVVITSDALKALLEKISDRDKYILIRMIKLLGKSIETDNISWMGCMACCSDIISVYDKDISDEVRVRRLTYCDLDAIPVNDITMCKDILNALEA